MERKLALEYIKKRKKKNIVAIITIFLVTAFLTGLGIYYYSYNTMVKNELISISGQHHGDLFNVDEKYIPQIERYSEVLDVGTMNIGPSEKVKEGHVYLYYYDEMALNSYNLKVIDGKYPEKPLEIAIEKIHAEKINKNVGDRINYFGKEFKISGIIDNLDYKKDDKSEYVLYGEKKYVQSVSGAGSILVKLNNPKNYVEAFKGIEELIKIKERDIFYNMTAIEMKLGEMSEISAFAMLGGLIIISSFFIIYNIFYISLRERVKTLGLLKTIGFTRKQIRKLIIWESVILSIIAIPLGILLGVGISKFLIANVGIQGDLRFLIHPIIIPIVILIVLLTVIFSVWLPANKVSKVSPIEAIRIIPNVKAAKGKKFKNILKDLARINVWRNKKSATITIISMTFSIILFIAITTVVKSMNVDSLVQFRFTSNVEVMAGFMSMVEEDYIKKEVVDKIKDGYKGKVEGLNLEVVKKIDGEGMPNATYFIGINDDILNKAVLELEEGELDVEKFKAGKTAIVPKSHGKSQYKLGEYVELEGGKAKVVGLLKNPVLYMEYAPNIVYIYNKSDLFKGDIYSHILIESSKEMSKSVAEQINSITKDYANLDYPANYKDYYDSVKAEKEGITLIGYIVVAVVGMIGLMNFINSTISEILVRKKELGMLRAIGMTDKETRKLLVNEIKYKISISLCVGICVGITVGYGVTLFLKNVAGATFILYSLPLIEILMCIIVIILVVLFVIKITVNRITKNSVVDQIRFED